MADYTEDGDFYVAEFFGGLVGIFILMNERAIAVYNKAGFQLEETFLQKTNGNHYQFVKMKLTL